MRVPDDLVGKRVKCPTCGAIFEAIPPAASAVEAAAPVERPLRPDEPPVVESLPDRPRERYADDYEDRPRRDRNAARRALVPGVFLMTFAILGGLSGLFFGVQLATMQNQPEEQLVRQYQQPPFNYERRQAEEMARNGRVALPAMIVGAWVLVAANLVIFLGALAMVVGRFHWLAVIASMLSLISLTCCCLPMPFGIWSLVVLFNPEVKSAFR
jgi:hypothetical protein